MARNGFFTHATMRSTDKSNKIIDLKRNEKLPLEILRLDVTDEKSVKEAIERIINEQGRIDALVNNAGYALLGPLEELSIMRRQMHGTIVNISSVAGRIGFPLTSAYVSSKFALEGLSESMAYEVEQFGIKVILIEPNSLELAEMLLKI